MKVSGIGYRVRQGKQLTYFPCFDSELIPKEFGMHNFIDLTGQVFSRLTVIERDHTETRHVKWTCQCECGNIVSVQPARLKNGDTRSCGCLQKELLSKSKKTHGDTSGGKITTEFYAWDAMHKRCSLKTNASYENYGGRGITVCDEWKDFEVFLKDMGRKPAPSLSLDRKDNKKGYSKSNCKWSTKTEQTLNRKQTIFVTYKGKRVALAELARANGFDPHVVNNRVTRCGWTVERAISTPQRKSPTKMVQTQSMARS